MKPSDSNWLRTMFHIVGLEYPCFDTDLISMCSSITAPVWASRVWPLHYSRDPPSPPLRGEEMWSVCSVWTRLLFCDRPHKCEKLQPPPWFYSRLSSHRSSSLGKPGKHVVSFGLGFTERRRRKSTSQRVEQTWTLRRVHFTFVHHLKVLCSEK